jgi:hypothetical protein
MHVECGSTTHSDTARFDAVRAMLPSHVGLFTLTDGSMFSCSPLSPTMKGDFRVAGTWFKPPHYHDGTPFDTIMERGDSVVILAFNGCKHRSISWAVKVAQSTDTTINCSSVLSFCLS